MVKRDTYIYVIESAIKVKDEQGNSHYEQVLKIGYTSSWKKRWDTYDLHNPSAEVLFLIEGGNTEDELRLKRYFKKYLIHREEWFKCNSEILNFFRIHKTIEDIRKAVSYITVKSKIVSHAIVGIKKKFWPFIYSITSVLDDKVDVNELCEIFKFCRKDKEQILKLVCDTFPDLAPCILQEYDEIVSLDSKSLEFVDILRDGSINFSKRLRLLCETPDFTEEEKLMIAKYSSPNLYKYYTSLDHSRLKALGYKTDKLNRELSNRIILKSSSVKDSIIAEFKIGNRYKKSDIKETLKNVYDKLNLKKTPKANDIGEYLDLKPVTIIDPVTKKRDNGFEIIKIKE